MSTNGISEIRGWAEAALSVVARELMPRLWCKWGLTTFGTQEEIYFSNARGRIERCSFNIFSIAQEYIWISELHVGKS